MKRFEYTFYIDDFPINRKKTLDDYGKQGWELISVVILNGSFYHYFKREIQ